MNCFICSKYQGDYPHQAITELGGMALSHFAPGDNGLAMKGRLLIEPIHHVTQPEELTSNEFANMGMLLQKSMVALKKVVGAEHVYFFRINDLVPHFHFHVVPRYPGTPKEFWGLNIINWLDYPKLNLQEIQDLSLWIRGQI